MATVVLFPGNLYGEPLRPANERFVDVDSSAIPDFQRHVSPLLGRLGCNGRACHGSFQGRGGLRLSLFGYDFKQDYQALTSAASHGNQNRIDRRKPTESLILQKPTFQIDHEGGELFQVDSWEHHLLLRWIASKCLEKGGTARRFRQTMRAETPISQASFKIR